MTHVIADRSGTVIWHGEADDICDAVVRAVAGGADLRDANLYRANLYRANLYGADLRGANLRDAWLPTGERFDVYLRDVVPALLVAGGKSLQSFSAHWTCHDWTNCPIRHAFDADVIDQVPVLLRPRAEQFIQLFDAGLIPCPAGEVDPVKTP